MPLGNAVRCFICNGEGCSVRSVAGSGSVSYWCDRCHGTGQLCSDCHKPDGACECVTDAEPCEKCGKLACRCK